MIRTLLFILFAFLAALPVTAARELSVETPEARMLLRAGEEGAYLASLSLKGGKELIGAPCPLALPRGYMQDGAEKPFRWQFVSASGNSLCRRLRFEDGAAGYTLMVSGSRVKGAPFQFEGFLSVRKPLTIAAGEAFRAEVRESGEPLVWAFAKESGFAYGWRLYSGVYTPGSGIRQTRLAPGAEAAARTNTEQNWNAGGDIPMLYIDYGDRGLYLAFEWSNTVLMARGLEKGGAALSAALADGNMVTRLPEGGGMRIPPVYLGVYKGDVDDGSNAFKRWFVRVKAPKAMLSDVREPLIQQDMQLGYDVAKYGIEQIKMDYGWWSDEKAGPTWRTHEGLLEMHNSDYLKVLADHGCRTLPEYVGKARKAGVGVTMYILLKDTQLDRPGVPTSVGKYGHPEWFSDVNVTGMGCSADLGNTECVAFYKKYLLDFFRKTGVTTWRSDFEPICRTSPRENRHLAGGNDVQFWATVGFGELVDYLRAKLPGFRYESCSSGGSMKDLWTMTKCNVINCDDSADYMSLHMSFYDSSYCIHPMQLQIPCNALTYTRGSENYTGTADYLYGLRCQLTGGVMLSNWKGTTEEDKAYWPYHVGKLYAGRLRPLIRNGDLYHILPRPDGVHWDGLEYFDPDTDTGAVMLWKPGNEEGNEKTVPLRGLDPKKEYRLSFEDRRGQSFRARGESLLREGLRVAIAEPVGSEIVWITPAK